MPYRCPYPDDFYYFEKNNDGVYSDDSEGAEYDFERCCLSVGEDPKCWRKEGKQLQPKAKTLILADWTLCEADFEKRDKLKAVIRQMLREGFSIFIWQGNHLKKMSNSMLIDDVIIRDDITPALEKDILHFAKTSTKLIPDKTKVLSDYEVGLLIGNTPGSPRYIDEEVFKRYKNSEYVPVIREFLKKNPQVLLKRIHWVSPNGFAMFGNNAGKFVDLKVFPCIFSENSFTRKDFWGFLRFTEEFIPEIDPYFDPIKLPPIDPVVLERIKKIYLKSREGKSLLPFLQQAKLSPTELYLQCNAKDADDYLSDSNIQFDKVRKANFLSSIFDVVTLYKFLAKCKQLEELHLEELYLVDSYLVNEHGLALTNHVPVTFPLKTLKFLSIMADDVNTSFLQENLLKSASNLKHVDITVFNLPVDIHLDKLETMSLKISSELSGQVLMSHCAKFFGAMPNLKKLELSENGSNSIFLNVFSAIPSAKLETLVLRGDSSNKPLSIVYDDNTLSLPVGDAFLGSLKKLDVLLSDSMPFSSFCQFLNASPNVTELTVRVSKNSQISFENHPLPPTLTHMKHLRFSGTHSKLFTLLDRMPYLQILEIEGPMSIDKIFPERLNLEHVEILKLSDKMPNLRLIPFINHMPKLQEFHLSGEIFNPCGKHLDVLNELRFLHFDESAAMDINFFIQLLEKSPHLDKIHFNAIRITGGVTVTEKKRLEGLLLRVRQIENHEVLDQALDQAFKPLSSEAISLNSLKQPPGHSNSPSTSNVSTVEDNSYRAFRGTAFCDTNTTNENKKNFHVKQIFWSTQAGKSDPDVRTYRLSAYNQVMLDPEESPQTPKFILSSVLEPSGFIACDDVIKCNEDVFAFGKEANDTHYGKDSFVLTPGEWQPIPSLSPNEKMTHVHISPSWAKVHIMYDPKNRFYYMTSSVQQTVSLDFLIRKELTPAEPTLPKEAKEFLAQFNHDCFSPKKFMPPEENTLDAVVNALLDQKTGACRHRAVCAKHKLEQILSTETQIITNQLHTFVEFTYEGQCIKRDLGGYDADLRIDKSNAPNRDVEKKIIDPDLIQYDNQTNNPIVINQRNAPKSAFLHLFETWKKAPKKVDSARNYFEALFQEARKKHLLCLPETRIADTIFALQVYAQETNRPTIIIQSPNELKCYKKYFMLNKDGQGEPQKGYHGKLYQLSQDVEKPPLLIINMSAFTAEDIIHHKDFFAGDKDIQIDGVSFSPKTSVICLMDPTAPNHTSPEDVFTLIQKEGIREFPEDSVDAVPLVFPTRQEVESALPLKSASFEYIQLNHGSWYAKLIGAWTFKEGQFIYKEGELVAALKSGKPIQIHNPPFPSHSVMSDELDFHFFWQQVRLQGKFEDKLGNEITVTAEDLQRITLHEGYAWESLQQSIVSIDNQYDASALILNPTRWSQFLRRKEVIGQQLHSKKGFLEDTAEPVVSVYLTRELSEDCWAQLLEECQRCGKKLTIHCAPFVTLPDHFPKAVEAKTTTSFSPPEWNNDCSDNHTQVIITEDSDTTIEKITDASNDEWIVLDISECKISDLIKRIREIKTNNQILPQFSEENQALFILLEEKKKNVIIKGQFSPELLDELAAFIQQRQLSEKPPSGRLFVLSEKPFPTLATFVHTLTEEEKARVDKRERSMEEDIQQFLDIPVNFIDSHFDINTSKDETQAFIDGRIHLIEKHLADNPYVFIGGLTGVGKSTFIDTDFKNDDKRTFYVGADTQTRKDCYNAKNSAPDKYKILVVDEATLLKADFTEFEGLFYDPPWTLIDGKPAPLTKKHKVIFMGNPLSYGNRKLARLFAKHGLMKHFDPLPKCFIYERIIKPVFENSQFSFDIISSIAEELLNMYQFLVERSRDDIRISPREIQMMALLTTQYCQKNAIIEPDKAAKIARHYAYQMSHALLSVEEYKTLLEQSPLEVSLYDEKRDPVKNRLDELFHLREYRRSIATLNSAQRAGGLGGLIIENDLERNQESAVLDYLQANGMQASLNEQVDNSQLDNAFYVISPDMSDEKKAFYLVKAFREGAIVFLKDPNTTRLPERLLNDLLMGTLPKEYQLPNKNNDNIKIRPGFMLLMTQVPATEGNRRQLSSALLHRLQQYHLPFYSKEELLEKSVIKRLPEAIREGMVDAFLEQRQYAEIHGLSPKPRWADLERTAVATLKKIALQDMLRTTPTASASTPLADETFTSSSTGLCEQLKEQFVNMASAVLSRKTQKNEKYELLFYMKEQMTSTTFSSPQNFMATAKNFIRLALQVNAAFCFKNTTQTGKKIVELLNTPDQYTQLKNYLFPDKSQIDYNDLLDFTCGKTGTKHEKLQFFASSNRSVLYQLYSSHKAKLLNEDISQYGQFKNEG